MKIAIHSHFNGAVLFEHDTENNTIKETLQIAILRGANLRGANLRGANLEGADLRGADLRGANLEGEDLRGANLEGANLEGANLEGANLRVANLRGANLRGADLRGANLRGANLRGADLEGEVLKKTPIQINNLNWPVLISDSYLRIGCQHHSIDEWKQFSDTTIDNMDRGALKFWKIFGPSIIAMCDAHNAE